MKISKAELLKIIREEFERDALILLEADAIVPKIDLYDPSTDAVLVDGDAREARPVGLSGGDRHEQQPRDHGWVYPRATVGGCLDPMLERAAEGMSTLAVGQATRDQALANLGRWLTEDVFVPYRAQIEGLIDRKKWEVLLDSFYQVIPFGTGGRRGSCGIGPNRINPWTLATSVQGHVEYLQDRFPDEDLRVVIAYDVRVYRDRGGVYDPARPNPVLGLSSRDFAELAARVYAGNGVEVYMPKRGDDRCMSTPELSWAIRRLRTQAGLNVSASHNPPDDNGGKFYNQQGGQEIPPYDEAMVKRVEQVTEVRTLSWQKAKDSGLLRPLPDDAHASFVVHVAQRTRTPSRSAVVCYTPLHGTGVNTVLPVLRAAGFVVHPVLEQMSQDGDFPTVPFRAPNPEVPRAFDLAVLHAEEVGADLVLATDPDADRIGCVVRHDGGWRFLTGNEIGLLVAHHVLANRPKGGARPIVVQTEVTTGAIARMARAEGAQVVDWLLVGFKYIGEVLRNLETTGRVPGSDITGSIDDFVFGVEESHGVLITPYLRDKDAAGGALFLAELASVAKDGGKTLVDVLDGLSDTYGYVRNHLISIVMRGAVGRERIGAVQQSFRASQPAEIGGRKVTAFHDRRDPNGPFGCIVSSTDAASRDVLVFELGSQARVILRPSGTEPKSKVYVEVRGEPGAARAAVDAEAERLGEAFVDEMLARVDLAVPGWAHAVNDLVAIESKIHFASMVVPALVARIGRAEEIDAWFDEAIRPMGKDARRLVDRALLRFIADSALGEPVVTVLRHLARP